MLLQKKAGLRSNSLNDAAGDSFNITERNGLLSNDVKLVYADSENDLWIGYDLKGVSKISTLMFHKYNMTEYLEGLDANAVFSVLKDNGSFFCTTEKGIFKLQNSEFSSIYLPEKFLQRMEKIPSLLPVILKSNACRIGPGITRN